MQSVRASLPVSDTDLGSDGDQIPQPCTPQLTLVEFVPSIHAHAVGVEDPVAVDSPMLNSTNDVRKPDAEHMTGHANAAATDSSPLPVTLMGTDCKDVSKCADGLNVAF